MNDKPLREQIADRLATEAGYGRVSADALARGWHQLGADRGWSDELTTRVAMDAAVVGIMPDAVRMATDVVDEATAAIKALGIAAGGNPPRKATGRTPHTRKR
jgi:hypothetical protein